MVVRAAYTFALVLAVACGAPVHAAGTLNIYNWGNYTPPALIQKFEEQTGIRVTITEYDSNDTALARVRRGGHGFDIVVPSNSYLHFWIDQDLLMPLDRAVVRGLDNIDPRWRDVDFDPGRRYSVPWLWGTTGVIVDTSVWDGDIDTADIFLDPPEPLRGRINVIPQMSDVMHLAVRAAGGEPCTDDREVLQAVRAQLDRARHHWIAIDYGTIDGFVAGDIAAGVYWNGAALRVRLARDDFRFGYPQTGFPIWMDNAAVLADARNPEAAMKFIDFILEPEHAAMISNFARYANGIAGSERYLDEVMRDAPEIRVPDELADAGRFSVACPREVHALYMRIWTEVLR